jgi:hypothetical protein
MKILFIGDLNEYGRCLQRYKTLVGLGHEVLEISSVPVPRQPTDSGFLEAVSWKLRMPLDAAGANEKIKKAVVEKKFDVIWIEKGNTIKPSTLIYAKKKSPSAKLISVSEDDMYGRHNRSLYYDRGLSYYDVVFTTKTYNLEELKTMGAKRTELFLDSYNENIHKPIELTEEEKKLYGCDVGFIGSYEKDRAEKMLYLAERGIRISVWGNDWEKWLGKHQNLDIKNKHLYNEEYPKAINAIKINLCFLRKLNRDEVTSRSVEIPACGGFMLAERTKRHLEFFEEDKEAVFFGSKEELLEKVKKYLADEPMRLKIAAAGRERCLKSGYSMKTQLEKIIEKCLN